MSSRGRGGYGGYGGRGGYNSRGSGYRGSYRGSGRGSYESRGGGRGGGGSSYYNNDSRYNSSGPRYSSNRDRIDDSYKKPYRVESTVNYPSRDYGGRSGSPERKRLRMEGSSDRRSHDGGGHYYGGRQDNYERRGYGGEERRRSMSRETREGYRKTSDMPPPRSPARARVLRPPRRSFRGRSLRTRGSYRGPLRSRPSFAARRYSERPIPYARPFRSIKGHSNSIKSKDEDDEDDEEASSTEEDWDAEDKEDLAEEKSEPKVKASPKAAAEGAEAAAAEASGSDTDKEADAGSEEAPRRRPARPALTSTGRPYVHLACVHCKEKYATFGGYSKHLAGGAHRAAMNAVARRHKAALLRMRVAQRGAQRSLEAAAGAELAARTTFCLICRLNHRTTRHAHNLTDTHRAMKRFLMPSCRTCRLTFRSPMIYEHHICSLEHLKRKSNQAVRRPSPKAEGSGDEGMDVDLENFMTLDSVGDVDEVDDEDSGGEKREDAEVKKPKVEINIGSEHIKKLEVYWCELCRVYLPRPGGAGGAGGAGAAGAAGAPADAAEALRRHCRLRLHLGRYVQHRDTRTLRRHAERIHRQLHQAAKGEKNSSEDMPAKIKSEKNESGEEKKLENGNDQANQSGSEDKLWADVDKDIGELLREVDPQANEPSDDEDLSRYDKFRKSDKKSATEAGEGEVQTAENADKKSPAEIDTSA